ncbi:hypothetical protein NKW84_04085 [Acetobacter senegalensis]|uniref:hypothetical protein n=1 Tax=Acetobacter TaxID=434 RepID=UPI001EDB4D7A|nr:hypothetical protein [Acetobacter senegalensis]MCG4254945.1 hypothetical protein [Acetobacter senegalensis]MCP1195042.1 hypothetical protein [Acetobacter senegalensis]
MNPSTEARKRDLVKSVLQNFVITPVPAAMLVNDQVQQWLKKYEIAFAMDWLPTGETRGFKQSGVNALIELTSILREEEPTYRRGTRPERLAVHVAHSIVTVFQNCLASIPTPDNIVAIEKEVRLSFSAKAVTCTHCIPCRIIPEHASSFSVGPVEFYSQEDLIQRENISRGNTLKEMSYGPLLEFMQRHSAYWIADVTVDGFDDVSGLERANIAIDLALVAVQIAIPPYYSRCMARLTDRTLPSTIGSVTKVGGNARFGSQRCDPGLGFSAGEFDQFLSRSAPILVSIGSRVRAFITDNAVLPRLDQSWSDAAYWLHEGLTEPLDTVAVTKLETAIEVLLSAASSKNSASRLKDAFSSFYGLSPNCSYPTGSTQKVDKVVKAIVESRSRILHGTLSTLTADSLATDNHGGRSVLEFLCMDLLAAFSLKLDAYATIPAPKDNIEDFLQFVSAERKPTT